MSCKLRFLLTHKISIEIDSFLSRPKYKWRFLCPLCPRMKSALCYDTSWKEHSVVCDECGICTMWRGYSCVYDKSTSEQHDFCMDCVYGQILKKQMFIRVLSDLIGVVLSHDCIDLVARFVVGEIVRVPIGASKRSLQQSNASDVQFKVSKKTSKKRRFFL